MCNTFYHWEIDTTTGFRKILIDEVKTDLIKEIDKFNSWIGDFKICKSCNRSLPSSTYFFKRHPQNKKDGLLNKCKECQGNRFTWGLEQKEIFKESNSWYCTKCDTVFPLNELYFARSKDRNTGFTVTCKKCSTYPSEYGISRFLNHYADVKENFQICLECLVELPRNQEYYFKAKRDANIYETKCKKCQGQNYGIIMWNSVLPLAENERFCSGCNKIKDKDDFYHKSEGSDTKYSRCKKCHYISSQNRRHQQSNADYTLEDWNFSLDFFKGENNKYCCAYCGAETNVLEKEHIHPFSKGGQLTRANIIPSCKNCNCSKCDKTLYEFYMAKDSFTEILYNKIIEYVNLFDVE